MDMITDENKFILGMVFKSHLIALSMESNFKLINERHEIPDDLKDWGYYLNLSGQPHRYNKLIKFNNPIDNTIVILTKEYLDLNEDMRSHIKGNWNVLEELMKLYPGDNTYIMGMLNPININDVVEAKEGKILYYDKTYIKYYELSIINELEQFISNYLFNYGNPGYIVTDNLYTAGLEITLYQGLVSKLKELRYYNQDTYMVSEEYMSARFNSNLLIGEFLTRVPRSIRLYLYKNLDYIKHNIGKDSTINILIDNVIKPLKLNLSEVILKPTNTKIISGNIYTSNQSKVFNTLNLRDRVNNKPDIPVSYDTIFSAEVSGISDNFSKAYYNNDITLHRNAGELKIDRGVFERSKHFILSNGFTGFNKTIDREKYVIESIIVLLTNTLTNNYDIKINNTEKTLTGEMLLILFLFYLESLTGIFKPIEKITISHLFTQRGVKEVISDLYNNSSAWTLYSNIAKDLNNFITISLDEITSKEKCSEIIDETFNVWMRIYGHTSILNNGIFASNMDLLYKRFLNKTIITLPTLFIGKDMLTIINEKNIRYNEDPLIGINDIITGLTGISLINSDGDLLGKDIAGLMDRLTSYTVDFLYDEIHTDLLLPHTSLETLYGVNTATLNNFNYNCKGDVAIVDGYADDDKLDYVLLDVAGSSVEVTDINSIPDIIGVDINNEINFNPISSRSITIHDI